MGRLEGKVALVTGAGRGIGRAIAIAYAGEGAAVSCVARTPSEIEGTVGAIEKLGGAGLTLPADVTQLDSVQQIFESTVQRFGGLDILVVSAGVSQDLAEVENSVPEDWVNTLSVNLVGAYYCAKAAIPHLKRRGSGKIIMIGSGVGHRGLAKHSAYSCSKAGLWMLTRVLAQELWQHKISVNELIPGPVETRMSQEGIASLGEDTPFSLGSEWVKSPEDVTPLAIFLATQPDIGPTAQSFSLMRRDG